MRIVSAIIIASYVLMLGHGIGHAEFAPCHSACEDEAGITLHAGEDAPGFAHPPCGSSCCGGGDCAGVHYDASLLSLASSSPNPVPPAPVITISSSGFDGFHPRGISSELPVISSRAPTYLRNLALRI